MFRSLPLFLNGLLLLAVLGSAACSHCEETFVVPEDARYMCAGDTGGQLAAFINRCGEEEDPFAGCSPREQCSYVDEQGTACAYCLPREVAQHWIDNNCAQNCAIKEAPHNYSGVNFGSPFTITCR